MEIYGEDVYKMPYKKAMKLFGLAMYKDCIAQNVISHRREEKTDIYDIHNIPRPRRQGIRVYSKKEV